MTDSSQRPRGHAALGAVGDYVMANDFLTVVIDSIDHPNHLATTGGNILDIAPAGGSDHIHQIYVATGILPRDGTHYESIEILSQEPAVIVARGHLEGDAAIRVVTRYELRPCDRGIRVRTEIFNAGSTIWASTLTDGYWLGDRGLTPFVPLPGQGFHQPALDLLNLDTAWRRAPFVVASSHVAPESAYATVACTRERVEGFSHPTIAAQGTPRIVLTSGDGMAFERIILAAPGAGVDPAAELALEVRRQVFNEPVQVLTGRVVTASGEAIGGDERRADVLVYEPGPDGSDDEASIHPWSQAIPTADGRFAVHVPAGHTYRARVSRNGRPLGQPVATQSAEGFGDIVVTPLTHVTIDVTDATSHQPLDAEIIFVPTAATPRDSVHGTENGYFDRNCAPYLGPPHSTAPACNRALAYSGHASLTIAPGTYWVYAHAGPSRTLARTQLSITEGGDERVQLALENLPGIFPTDALAGDFHVHSGRSFDITLPAVDRVETFITSGIQVIAATEHDVVGNFDPAIQMLNAQGRMVVMPGVEATPNVPWFYPPGATTPKVIGHVGSWPIRYDPSMPRDGAPWDELMQPGELFDRLAAATVPGEQGVIQINHPTANSIIGRDLGLLRMLRFNPTRPLPGRDDGTSVGVLYANPNGSTHRNIDWDAQEAMQGQGVLSNIQYRAVWHALLNAGIRRAGTANSDSHSLTEEQLGYPRNIVLAGFDLAHFDRAAFNAAVRAGHMVGTNGPYVDARVHAAAGDHPPGLEPFVPAAGSTLEIAVRAAPWIPVTEVRIVVNGRVARTIPREMLMHPADPFGTTGTLRYQGSFDIAELMGGHDGWISVEAGMPLPPTVDNDNDGLVDLADLDGDGEIDDRDESNTPPDESDPRFHVRTVSPGTWPMAFTNPFVLDVDGNGWTAPGVSQ